MQLSDLDLLRFMQTARECDRRESLLHRQSKGWFQMSGAGHESTAVLARSMEPGDYLFPHYRDRALLLALGVSINDLALGYLAKASSSSGGRQMPNHFSDASRRIMSIASPTGLQCLPAAGTAWACQLEGRGNIVVCCLGDASSRQGEFYEAFSFALQESLPLVFVVEDNRYGISTPTARMNPFLINALPLDHVHRLNGLDVDSIHHTATQSFALARRGAGPSVLWIETERLMSHTSSDDQRIYRFAAELEDAMRKDPITAWQSCVVRRGELSPESWTEETKQIVRDVEEAYDRAFLAPDPDRSTVTSELYGPLPAPTCPGLPAQDGSAGWTMVSAVNTKLHQILERDRKVIVFGEDIEDPKGGVFGITRGLSSRFPGRVRNSPLSESTIAGTAAGLALAGFRPIFELQFIDFVGPAFNQIVNQIATLRWRSNGSWKCPVTFLAPSGAYLPAGGPWHSQTNESWFTHVPGLRVVEPSNPQCAAAMLDAASQCEDPVLILLPKHLFRIRSPRVPEEPFAFGAAMVRREGEHATIAAWGNCVPIALDAAALLSREGIDVEVVDLYSLSPCDWNLLAQSVCKTGKLMVVAEDNRTSGFGQTVIAEMAVRKDVHSSLRTTPVLVARQDVHVPYHPLLERAIFPQIKDLVEQVKGMLSKTEVLASL